MPHRDPILPRSCLPARAELRLLRNVGWYGLAELAARVSRLGTTVVLARALSSTELGVAAAALTWFELLRVLANTGIGQAVIRAPAHRLAATCNAAHRAVWAVCLAVAVVQAAVGAGIAAAGEGGPAGAMLACLALIYPLMAPGLVPVYLILRGNRLRVTAGIATAQVVADNLLTAAFALAGGGAWAVVLPKLLVAPIWLIGVRRCQAWRPDPAAGSVPQAELWRFAVPVLGSEALAAARLNLDKLLVGAILGVDALGIYYFVFNAGIGFSLSLTGALGAAIYPHLVDAGDGRALLRRFDRTVRTAVLPAAALIAAQAAASLLYVPLVFGARWQDLAPMVALLCLSAATKPLSDAASQLLRAIGRPDAELAASALLTALYLGTFSVALRGGLMSGIVALSTAAALLQLGFAAAARAAATRTVAP